jgi:hypothetical protein
MAMMTETPKVHKAFYAHLYGESSVLVKVNSVIYFMADSGDITEFEPEMATVCTVLGEVGLADAQAISDTLAGGAAWIATHRRQEAA